MSTLTPEILAKLAAPFPDGTVQYKPGVFDNKERPTRALALAYVEARDVMDRLDEVAGGDWEFSWEPGPQDSSSVHGILTVCNVRREDVGECGEGDLGTIKSAVSDALKRCGVHFGVGRYLYSLKSEWLDLEPGTKHFKVKPQAPAAPWYASPTNIDQLYITAKEKLGLDRVAVHQAIPDWSRWATGAAAYGYLKSQAKPEDAAGSYRHYIRTKATSSEADLVMAPNGLRGLTVAVLNETLDNDHSRHLYTTWLLDKPGSSEWTTGECRELQRRPDKDVIESILTKALADPDTVKMVAEAEKAKATK